MLETHREEWSQLDAACRISISRFFRDRFVFDYLAAEILPKLAERAAPRGETELRAWSIGCAAGEEVYGMTILWRLELQPRFPGLAFRVLGTDADQSQLARAETACYPGGSLKAVPLHWRQAAFQEHAGSFCLRPEFRAGVTLRHQDIRRELPQDERFHLVLCRNLAFTYFAEKVQRQIASALRERLPPGGILVLGQRERLPPGVVGFAQLAANLQIYQHESVP